MTKPIKPNEIYEAEKNMLLDIFNQLIVVNWDGKKAKIKDDDFIDLYSKTFPESTQYSRLREQVEKLYRDVGWVVYRHRQEKVGWYYIFEWPINE